MWWSVPALAQSTIELERGPTLLQPCLDSEDCVGTFGPQLSETLLDAGYELQHEPLATSVFGSAGLGVVIELALGTTPLGPRNDLQSLFPSVPLVPRFAAGGVLELPGVALAAGVHGLPTLSLGEGTTSAYGLTVSAAGKPVGMLRIGGELVWTHATFAVSLFDSSGDLRQLELLKTYVPRGVTCAEPCLDTMRENGLSARAGVGLVPIDELFVFAKGGVTSQVQHLDIALDESGWRVGPVMPEWAVGAGTRLGGHWQLATGFVTAYRPEEASTEGRAMTRFLVSTAFRFGPP